MKTRIFQTAITLLTSLGITILLFALLAYSGLLLRGLDLLLKITGNGRSEGEDRGAYYLDYAGVLAAVIFAVALIITSRFLFRKKKFPTSLE